MVRKVIAEVECTGCGQALILKNPLEIPCLVNVVCPYCETVLRQEVLEEDVATV